MQEIGKETMSVSLLTYNIGLLDYELPGLGVVYSYPDHAEERLHHVPDAIRKANADIVCLQECYTSFQINYVISQLSDIYPYNAHCLSSGWWKLQNGMLTLSKYPILHHYLLPFSNISSMEAWFANKSQLVSVIQIPGIGDIAVINIHTTAGGYFLPTHPLSDLDRDYELEEVDACAKDEEARGRHSVVIGDYNCGPYSSRGNWLRFKSQLKYRDLFVEAFEGNRWWSENGEPYTWHPTNYLNAKGPHKELPPDRLDHIMVKSTDPFWNNWYCSRAQILFTEPCVDVGLNGKSSISDHYGLLCELSLSNSTNW